MVCTFWGGRGTKDSTKGEKERIDTKVGTKLSGDKNKEGQKEDWEIYCKISKGKFTGIVGAREVYIESLLG